MTELLGTLLADRYRLERVLGQGGMGVVYQATDATLERQVAVKVLSKAEPGSEGRARLLAEARSAARLNHPNIVAIHDAGEFGETPFVVMEMVQGQTLRETAAPGLDEALKIIREICAALDHAHQFGIIHRDVKPENVILTGRQIVKLMDFGLAYDPKRSRLTQDGTLVGTMAYLAPELIMGQPASPQSDLYALGVMLYEMVAGRPPFEGDNPAVLLTNHLHAPVVPPSAHNPAITPALDALVVDLLRKEPTRRPPSAAVVLERLVEVSQPVPTELPIAAEVPVASLLDRIARGRLVGRTEQLAQATQLWLRALSGQAGMLLISGEPGIGKTRLAQAIVAQARVGGATVLSGGCYEFEAMTPYLPMAEALLDWVHRVDDANLRAMLGNTATELARLAPDIENRLGPLPASQVLEAEEQRLRLFDNVAHFFETLAGEQGLLLFVDDLHWADQGTLSLLSYLMRRLRSVRLLIVAGYREIELDRRHPLAEALVQWNRQRQVERIQLSRFTVAETNKLIATLFGQESVSDEFASAIFRETEGNPFFIEEVMKALIDHGQIYWVDDHWERDELEDLAIPQSIKEAIGRRLNRLSQACVDILHTAAVIGKDFPYPLLAEVASEAEEEILDALEEAIAAQLIRPLTGEAFIFTHDKIREVLYDEILTVRRNRLHRQIGQALEDGLAGDPANQLEPLAYHLIAAGVLDKGMAYALQAAEKASNVFAYQEALEYYRQAMECALSLGDTAAQASILEAMGDIYRTTGPLMASIDHYQKTIDLQLDPERQAAIRVKIGRVYNLIGDERGIAVLERALQGLDEKKQPLLVSEAWAHLGRYYHYRCHYRTAIEYFEKARELAEPFQDPEPLYYIYAYLAGAYQHLVRMKESIYWAEVTIAMGKKLDHYSSIAVGHEFLAEDYAIMGYWEKALEAAKINHDIGKKIGSANRLSWSKFTEGQALLGLGKLRQATEEITSALDRATTIGEDRLLVLGDTMLALTYIEIGDHDKAREHLNKALERNQQMVEIFGRGYILTVRGYFHLNEGDHAQAVEQYREAYDLLEGTDNRDVYLASAADYAEALLNLGRDQEALSHLEDNLSLALEAPSPRAEGTTWRVFGQYHMMQGDYDKAAEAFDRAITILAEIKSRLALGRVYARRAVMHEQQGRPDLASQDALQAQSIFEECGAARDDLHIKSLLARLR